MKPSDYDGRVPEPPYPTLADDNAMLVKDNQDLRERLAAAEAEIERLREHQRTLVEELDGTQTEVERLRGCVATANGMNAITYETMSKQLAACRTLLREACEADADARCLGYEWREAARAVGGGE